MKFAFDIDGTISALPAQFAALMAALFDAGHEVHVLTGTMDPIITDNHYQTRWTQLKALGVDTEKVTRLAIVTNPPITAKRDYCQQFGINLLFEDSIEWATPALSVCPVLMVTL